MAAGGVVAPGIFRIAVGKEAVLRIVIGAAWRGADLVGDPHTNLIPFDSATSRE